MHRFLKRMSIVAVLVAMVSAAAGAGETGHYVNGVEGIKAASVPGPGFYYKMYNAFYRADTLTDDSGLARGDSGPAGNAAE